MPGFQMAVLKWSYAKQIYLIYARVLDSAHRKEALPIEPFVNKRF